MKLIVYVCPICERAEFYGERSNVSPTCKHIIERAGRAGDAVEHVMDRQGEIEVRR